MRQLLFLTLLCPLLSNCQPIILKGKIINEQMEPIAGATITLKGAAGKQPPSFIYQLSSDAKGEFTLTSVSLTDTLIVSAIGYETAIETLDFNSRGLVTIILKRKTALLDEVVVNTGYQQLPKERSTGSFTFLNSKTLQLQQGTNILDRLRSVSNGLLFDNSSDRPSLTVRGLSSILSAKTPLIILDNFPYEGDISNINPADIESVSILKDAAAASVWGTRAGNGVIVLTSKKGHFNQPLKIDWSSNITTRQKPDLFYTKSMSSTDFIDMEQFLFSKGFYEDKEADVNRPLLSPVVEWLIAARDGRVTAGQAADAINNLRQYDLRSAFEKYVYQNAFMQQHAISFKGGSSNITSLLSAGWDRSLSELSASYNRYTLRSENTFRLAKNLRLQAGLHAIQSVSITGRTGYENFSLGSHNPYPYARLIGDDGSMLPFYTLRQTYIDTAGAGRLLDWKYYPLDDYKNKEVKNTLRSVIAQTGLQYRLLKTLALNLTYQYQLQQSFSDNWQGLQSFNVRDLVNRFSQVNRATGVVTYNVPKEGILDLSENMVQAHSFRGQFNYDAAWGVHNFSAIAGAEWRNITDKGNAHRIYGYNNEVLSTAAVDYLNPYPSFITGYSAFIPSNLDLYEKLNRYVSLYANAAYTFKDRYTLSGSIRKDASNIFGVNANQKGVPLWSAGASWNIGDEPFYKFSILPVLKLRASYGFDGNVALDRSAVTTMNYFSGAQYTNFLNARLSQFSNPELRWEKVNTLNLGVDFEIKKTLLSGSVDYYLKRGTDLFGNAPVDYTTGVGSVIIKNVAAMKGSGLDVQLNLKTRPAPLQWLSTLIFNYNATKVTRYFLTKTQGNFFLSDGNSITAMEGQPVYALISYRWGGLDSLGNPVGFVNGVSSTDYTEIAGIKTGLQDLVYSGPAVPPFFGSFQNTLSFKGFSVTANISYKFGHFFRRESINYQLLLNDWHGHSDFEKRWQHPGDEMITTVPSFVYPLTSQRDDFYRNAEVLVTPADNIRLEFLNFSYELNKKSWKSLPLKALQLYINAANLGILWRANNYGIDPDYGSIIPPSPTFSFGFKAGL